jgi:hypothetical protein
MEFPMAGKSWKGMWYRWTWVKKMDFGDSAFTFAVGDQARDHETTLVGDGLAIKQAIAGQLGDVGYAVSIMQRWKTAMSHREMVGLGSGTKLRTPGA